MRGPARLRLRLLPPCRAISFLFGQPGLRLEEGELSRAVLANMLDEKGARDAFGVPEQSHVESWLDFAEGWARAAHFWHRPIPERRELPEYFTGITW